MGVRLWSMLNQEASETYKGQGQIHNWIYGYGAQRGRLIGPLYLECTFRK